MNPQNPSYSVICVHFGDPAITTETLQSLLVSSIKPRRIVVIDHDGQPYVSSLSSETITVVRPPINDGYGAGITLGLGVLAGTGTGLDECVIVMNNDLFVPPQAVEILLTYHQQSSSALLGVRQGVVNFISGRAVLLKPDVFLHPSWTGRAYLDGAFLAASMRVWARLKGFPSDFFLYWEDVALSERARRHNIPLLCVPNTGIHHDSERKAQRSEKTYYLVRNGAYFLETMAPLGWRLVWRVTNRLRSLWHALRRSPQPVRRGLRDARRRKLGKRWPTNSSAFL